MSRPLALAALRHPSRMAAGPASSSAATQASDGRPRAAVARGRIPQRAPIPAPRAPARLGPRPQQQQRNRRVLGLQTMPSRQKTGHLPPGHHTATPWPLMSPWSVQAHEPQRSNRSRGSAPRTAGGVIASPRQRPCGTTSASARSCPNPVAALPASTRDGAAALLKEGACRGPGPATEVGRGRDLGALAQRVRHHAFCKRSYTGTLASAVRSCSCQGTSATAGSAGVAAWSVVASVVARAGQAPGCPFVANERSQVRWKQQRGDCEELRAVRLAHRPGDAVVPPGAARLLSAWRRSGGQPPMSAIALREPITGMAEPRRSTRARG